MACRAPAHACASIAPPCPFHSGQLLENIRAIRGVALAAPKQSVVCEVGFNAGHSAIMWLEGTDLRLVSFDLMVQRHSQVSKAFVLSRYGDQRVHLITGSSLATFAAYADAVNAGCAPGCDIVSIDGLHTYSGALHDLVSALRSSLGTAPRPLLMDDVTQRFRGVQRVWLDASRLGLVREIKCEAHNTRDTGLKGWCIGEMPPLSMLGLRTREAVGRLISPRYEAPRLSAQDRQAIANERLVCEPKG